MAQHPKVHYTIDLPFYMPMACRPSVVPTATTRDRAQVTCVACLRKLARAPAVQEERRG